ncbi:MAG: AI-2E family transporter, partial [Candidatus Nanohaloarchaea archaeon]
LTLMMFLLYYFLKDGREMVVWVKSVLPMDDEVKDSLCEKVDQTTWAVIKSHVLVAIIQGLVAGLGLIVLGIPNSIFWTFVMVVLGFIPLVGTLLVWGPASVYLFLVNRPVAALALALYGFVVVGMTDNIVRPLAVDRSAELHPAVIIVGVLGGVYLFGAPGLFFGPILLGVFKSVLLVMKNNYNDEV